MLKRCRRALFSPSSLDYTKLESKCGSHLLPTIIIGMNYESDGSFTTYPP
jgi:hypothetical protein